MSTEAAEDHFLLRLGKGVIAAWQRLPEENQNDIIRQAVNAHDLRFAPTTQLEQQLRIFIREHSGNAPRT